METTAIGATSSFCKNVYTILGKDHHDHNMDVQVSIFRVPKSLSASKPEDYVPHLVGLGPYHHFRSELQQMQTYKLAELRKLRKGFRDISFKKLVDVLKKLVMQRIRTSYETYLDMDDESLACIIAIDGLFLFELLCCYGISRGDLFQSEFLCELVKSAGSRMARDTTLRDAMVLENQIPIFVLKVILIIELFSEKQGEPLVNDVVRELFPLMLLGFCKAVSPLAVLSDYPLYKALKHFHLVDLLYHLVTLDASPEKNTEEEEDEARFIQEMSEEVKKEIRPAVSSIVGQAPQQPLFGAPFSSLGAPKPAFSAAAPFSFSDIVPQELEKPVKLFEGLLKLPWAQLRSNILSAVNESPNVEEILIPKASELHNGGIKFCPADHITRIRFELNTLSFHLPLIKLDVNSEVILKNLVAYEAMIKSESEPLILTRYMELMGGLIESSDDVTVLKGVIHSESLKDDDVAKLFSGMSKSMRPTKTPDLDKQIAAVNDFYNDLWKVSASKFTKKWWRTAWSFCKVLAAFLVLLLMAIQAFCSVYECHRLSFRSDSPTVQQGFQLIPFRSNI